MWLANFVSGVWELGAVGAILLNVIEGGRSKKTATPPRVVDVGSLLQAVPEAMFLLDRHGRIGNLNQAAETLTGQVRTDLLGTEADSLLRRCLGSDASAPLVSQALRGKVARTGQVMFRTPSDSLRVIVTAGPVCDHAGHLSGALLTIQDVTELSALQTHSDSNERHVAVGQMTAGLVHDFSNVLNTIGEAVAVLEIDQQRSDRDLTVLGIIGNAVHYGAEIIRNTRDYLVGSREKRRRVDVRRLLEEVLELTHPLLKTHMGVNVVRETQKCRDVDANPDELRRAFTNLVLNALDAMPQGGTLTVNCKQQNDRVIVAVRDTGVGIPLEAQRKVFSPYFTTKAKGTGLGLAGAQRAIRAQGGEIRFESVPGAGTTFYVTLPVAIGVQHRSPNAA